MRAYDLLLTRGQIFAGSGGGWAPYWLERMDEHYETFHWLVTTLTLRPSDYFRRQCFISCDPEEAEVPPVSDVLGADKVLFASDYPHIDALFPGAVAAVRERGTLSAEAKQQVLGKNAAWLYRLD